MSDSTAIDYVEAMRAIGSLRERRGAAGPDGRCER